MRCILWGVLLGRRSEYFFFFFWVVNCAHTVFTTLHTKLKRRGRGERTIFFFLYVKDFKPKLPGLGFVKSVSLFLLMSVYRRDASVLPGVLPVVEKRPGGERVSFHPFNCLFAKYAHTFLKTYPNDLHSGKGVAGSFENDLCSSLEGGAHRRGFVLAVVFRGIFSFARAGSRRGRITVADFSVGWLALCWGLRFGFGDTFVGRGGRLEFLLFGCFVPAPGWHCGSHPLSIFVVPFLFIGARTIQRGGRFGGYPREGFGFAARSCAGGSLLLFDGGCAFLFVAFPFPFPFRSGWGAIPDVYVFLFSAIIVRVGELQFFEIFFRQFWRTRTE